MARNWSYNRSYVVLHIVAAALLSAGTAPAQEARLAAPNVVPISDVLVTSGQPTARALASLRSQGFDAVIYLAPGTVSDAVREEPDLLRAQGIEFVHIPIPFDGPSESHLSALSEALDRLAQRKVLVHCQVNMRASSLVFLYRVTRRKEEPAMAYEAVSKVWSPQGPWKRLLVEQLRKYQIDFEPF